MEEAESEVKQHKGKSPVATGTDQERKKVKSTEKNRSVKASTSKSPIERNLQGTATDEVSGSGAESVRVSLLVQALKRIISEPTSALKKTADQVYRVQEISIVPPSSEDVVPEISIGVEEKKPTLLVEDKEVSFRFPTEVDLDGIDIDRLESPHGCKARDPDNPRAQRFPFVQRLREWRIERRVRFNGRRDMFYHHKMSGQSFRSVVEVIDYIMFEVCPRTKEQKSRNKMSDEAESSNESQKRKQPYNDVIVIEDSPSAQSLSLEDIDRMIDSMQNMDKPATTVGNEDLIDHIPVCSGVSDLYELLNPNPRKG